jgi:Protein of unknown function (DUF3237)
MDTDFDESLPEPLKTIGTKPLFVMRLTVKPMQIVGATPGAFRRIGVVTGGTFNGQRIAGEVLDGGADWQVVRADGAVTLDVRLVLKTADGAMIGMTYTGIRHGPPEIIQTMEKGGAVDPASYYFRTTAAFETAAPQYAWLNKLVAVGAGHRSATGPTYSLFEVI